MSGPRKKRVGNDGFVLIAVLGLLALMSAVIVVMLGQSRGSLDTAMLTDLALRRDALSRSAVTLAAYELFQLNQEREQVNGQQIKLDEGVVSLTVETDAGKVDLNVSGAELLAVAYRATGLTSLEPESFAARVIDWRDADGDVSDKGAEAAAYADAGLDHGPRNGAFRTVDDLRWVLGISAADLERLRGLVTIYNPRGKLDVFSASMALIGVLPKITPETVDQILAARTSRNSSSVDALTFLLLRQSSLIDTAPPITFRVRIDARVKGDTGLWRTEVVLAPGATSDAPYHVLDWVEKT